MYGFNEILQGNKLKMCMINLCNKYTNQNAEHTKHKNTKALYMYKIYNLMITFQNSKPNNNQMSSLPTPKNKT